MENIEEYFSLRSFAHADLWKEGQPLWAPLRDLNDYLKTQVFRIEIEIPQGVYLQRPDLISIGKGTLIEPGVYIKGPCIIGKGSILRHGAYLRDCVICGDHVLIGHSTEVKHSILLDSAAVTHFCYVGDSIIGSGANLGAGVKCANLRLDRKEISVTLGGKRIKTGLRKFGALVGDRVQIGCNSVLNPGTLVGKDTVSYPLLNLGGTIPQRSKMFKEEKVTIESMAKPLLDLMDKARVP